jgi:flagellar L-ring protein FlgH
MKKLSLICLTVLGTLLATLGIAQQTDSAGNFGSLTPRSYRPIFSTRTARRVGEVLTVIISESSLANYQASTNTSKKEETKSGPNSVPLINFLGVGMLKSLTGEANSSNDTILNGQGQTTQNTRLSARMAVVIKQVLPNGMLVVEGTRAVKYNRETQQLTLSGLCRIDDIRQDNTILSENLGNAEIKSEGIGLIYERQRRGLITKLIDWLF